VDELRVRVRELEERERKESKKLADEDALRKIRVAEETIDHLQKKLTATKQVLYFHYTFKPSAEVLNMLYHNCSGFAFGFVISLFLLTGDFNGISEVSQ
jgi:hypothetical protein